MSEAPALSRLERYRRDPVAFAEEVLHWRAWSRQRQILESVRDHSRTAVASCHGPGKTATAAVAGLWYLSVYPHSRVISTAPTLAQVKDVLWREITRLYYASGGFMAGELFGTRLEIAPDWFAVGFTSDSAEAFQGHHAEHILVIADEASGIEETIFEAMAGSLTAPEARLLLIGNPTRTSGEFYAAFHAQRDFYNCIRISAFDTPAFTGENVPSEVARRLVSKTWVEDMTKKWGEGSPLWQVRINAEFPSQTDDAVVSLGDLEEAQRRSLEPSMPLVVACDVARYGSDSTVIATRTGDVVRIAKSYSGRDLMQTVGEILRVARTLEREHEQRPTIVVDDSGVGGGVVDRLQEQGEFEVVAFNAASTPRKKADYPRARDEAWFHLSELLPSLDLPLDEELAADLLAPRYSLDSQGRRAVEPKSETKSRLRRSPDRADAVVMAFALDGHRKPMRLSQGWKALARRDAQRELVSRGWRKNAYPRSQLSDPLANLERQDPESVRRGGAPTFSSEEFQARKPWRRR